MAGNATDKAKGTVALQDISQFIRQQKKLGDKDAVLKWTEEYQKASSHLATKFAPISPYQEAFAKEKKAAEDLRKLSPSHIKTVVAVGSFGRKETCKSHTSSTL